MAKYLIHILTVLIFCSCSTVKRNGYTQSRKYNPHHKLLKEHSKKKKVGDDQMDCLAPKQVLNLEAKSVQSLVEKHPLKLRIPLRYISFNQSSYESSFSPNLAIIEGLVDEVEASKITKNEPEFEHKRRSLPWTAWVSIFFLLLSVVLALLASAALSTNLLYFVIAYGLLAIVFGVIAYIQLKNNPRHYKTTTKNVEDALKYSVIIAAIAGVIIVGIGLLLWI